MIRSAVGTLTTVTTTRIAQRETVGLEGVGQDDPTADIDIAPLDGLDAIRVRQVPQIGPFSGREARGEELGPPTSIGEHRSLGDEAVDQLVHPTPTSSSAVRTAALALSA